MTLRFVLRDGKKILQELVKACDQAGCLSYHIPSDVWKDVPCIQEVNNEILGMLKANRTGTEL